MAPPPTLPEETGPVVRQGASPEATRFHSGRAPNLPERATVVTARRRRRTCSVGDVERAWSSGHSIASGAGTPWTRTRASVIAADFLWGES
jgi:hypothetical protein